MVVRFGQIVLGPPGSGKTTYCIGIELFCQSINRKCGIINLDFANDNNNSNYKPIIDIRDLIKLENVMIDMNLGPNGALIYCMEYLYDNIQWLLDRISLLDCLYIIIDCPGQVELYTHHTCVKDIINQLQLIDCRLCSVYLIDSYYCCDPATFISAVLVVTSTMLKLALPHVSVLTKVDLLSLYGPLPFQLDFFTELLDLTPLLRYLEHNIPSSYDLTYNSDSDLDNEINKYTDSKIDNHPVNELDSKEDSYVSPLYRKHYAMTSSLIDVLNDMNLVAFYPLDIQNAVLVGKVIAVVDKANGYSFANEEINNYENNRNSSNNQLFKQASNNENNAYIYEKSIEILEKYS